MKFDVGFFFHETFFSPSQEDVALLHKQMQELKARQVVNAELAIAMLT